MARGASGVWLRAVSRLGLVCRGTVYLLVGYLALRLELATHGRTGAPASGAGAVQAAVAPAWGRGLLVLLVAGLAAYALTQLLEAVFRPSHTTSTIGRWRQRAVQGQRPAAFREGTCKPGAWHGVPRDPGDQRAAPGRLHHSDGCSGQPATTETLSHLLIDLSDGVFVVCLFRWILVIGFLGLAVWRFVQAAVKRLNLTEGHRIRAFVYGVGYAIAFFATLMFVVHGTKPAAGDPSARDYTAQALSLDGGRVIVAFAGIALVVIGVVMAVRGFGAEFTRHLRMGWMSRSTQDAVVRLGQAGYVARGVVLVGIGIAAVDAAVTYDAAKAKGVDGVLRSFAQSPFGPWLLILVALGLIAFGILSFFEAKCAEPSAESLFEDGAGSKVEPPFSVSSRNPRDQRLRQRVTAHPSAATGRGSPVGGPVQHAGTESRHRSCARSSP
jgi:Domain of Unknown Function (DUF1206)